MQCDEVQAYLSDHFAGRLAGRLSGTVESYVRSHMLSCPECCEKLEDFQEMQAVLRSIPIEECDSNAMRKRFDAATLARKRTSGIETFPVVPGPRSRQSQILVAAGSILILVVALFVSYRNPKSTAISGRPGAVTGQVRSGDGAAARGVRVALMALPDPGTATAMELIRVAPTNEEGRYRLENVPPGRYYVIAGSVDVPTYFPGTPDMAAASIVSILPGAVADGIDFPRFVPARTIDDANAAAPVFLSGTLHYPDGRGAAGIPVYAIATDTAPGLALGASAFHFTRADFSTINSIARAQLRELQSRTTVEGTVTDNAGLYRIPIKIPGRYYIAAGFVDSPAFFPGVPDLESAMVILTTSSVNLASLHFTVPASQGATVSGRVAGISNALTGATIEMRKMNVTASLLPPRPYLTVTPDGSGTFEFEDVPSGTYILEARVPGSEFVRTEIVVNRTPVSGIQLALKPPGESGRESPGSELVPVSVTVLLDSGDRIPYKPETSIVFTGESGKNRVVASTTVGNLFQASVPAGDTYSVSVSNTADGYGVLSISSGAIDLLNGGRFTPDLHLSAPASIVVTLTKRNN